MEKERENGKDKEETAKQGKKEESRVQKMIKKRRQMGKERGVRGTRDRR